MVPGQTGFMTFFDANKLLLPNLQNIHAREANCCPKLCMITVQSLAREKQRTDSCNDKPLSFYSRLQESNSEYKCWVVNSLNKIPKPLQSFASSILTRCPGRKKSQIFYATIFPYADKKASSEWRPISLYSAEWMNPSLIRHWDQIKYIKSRANEETKSRVLYHPTFKFIFIKLNKNT